MLRNSNSKTGLALVLTIAMLPLVAVASPLFSVAAGPPASGGGCDGNISFISNSTTPVGESHVCSDNIGATSSDAKATYGSVGTAARAFTFSAITSPRIDEASASFRDQLVFSKTDPNLPEQFPVSLNLALDGILNAGVGPAGGSRASAGLEIDVSFLGGWVFDASYNPVDGLKMGVLNTLGSTGTVLPGVDGFNTLLTTPSRPASIGFTEFAITIYTRAASVMPDGSATADFLNTLGFPTGMDVFNLPAGYTVNAGDYLVNNRFIPSPNPAGVRRALSEYRRAAPSIGIFRNGRIDLSAGAWSGGDALLSLFDGTGRKVSEAFLLAGRITILNGLGIGRGSYFARVRGIHSGATAQGRIMLVD